MFDDTGARKLDENISQLVNKITKTLKTSEEKVKQMASPESLAVEEPDLQNESTADT